MGIEPTWDFVEPHHGFEDQDTHQQCKRLHIMDLRLMIPAVFDLATNPPLTTFLDAGKLYVKTSRMRSRPNFIRIRGGLYRLDLRGKAFRGISWRQAFRGVLQTALWLQKDLGVYQAS